MPAHAVDLETKQQGQTWLLPPYSYSLRQIAGELDVGLATSGSPEFRIKGIITCTRSTTAKRCEITCLTVDWYNVISSYCLPFHPTRSARLTIISQFNTRPITSPVNA